MSMRKHFFLYPLIVFFAFFFFSITTNEASFCLEKNVPAIEKTTKDLIEAGPGVGNADFKKQKLAAKIIGEYADLENLFREKEEKMGKEMAKILGKKATLVVGSDIYHGKREIKDFWNGVKNDYQTVAFSLKWAFIVSEADEMDNYDHIAYEAFEFHLYPPPEPDGKILKNQTGRGERSCRHTQICNCITR